MRTLSFLLALATLLASSSFSTAANKVVVIPLHSSAPQTLKLENVITVAKSGGDYSSVQTAIDSINDASSSNPYLVWVAPGVYNEMVTMKPYVHLQGAGQEATIISSAVDSGGFLPIQATLVLTHHVSLRDLTLGNTGVGGYNVALLAIDGATQTLITDVTAQARGNGSGRNYGIYLYGHSTGVTLIDVTALAENGVNNAGLYNDFGARATLRGGFFTGRGGINAYGIYNNGTGTEMSAESVTALAQNASVNYGLYNDDGAMAALQGGSFIARGGNSTRGIFTRSDSTEITAKTVSVLGENGSITNRGLESSVGADVIITQSVLEGAGNSIVTTGGGGPVAVSNSRLIGGLVGGNVSCVAVSRGTTFNASGCP